MTSISESTLTPRRSARTKSISDSPIPSRTPRRRVVKNVIEEHIDSEDTGISEKATNEIKTVPEAQSANPLTVVVETKLENENIETIQSVAIEHTEEGGQESATVLEQDIAKGK